MLIAKGVLTPGTGHDVRGSFTVAEEGGKRVFETSDDFFFDGSPAPGFAFTAGPVDLNSASFRKDMRDSDFFRLAPGIVMVTGRQRTVLPAAINLEGYNYLILWCYVAPFILAQGALIR